MTNQVISKRAISHFYCFSEFSFFNTTEIWLLFARPSFKQMQRYRLVKMFLSQLLLILAEKSSHDEKTVLQC